MGIGSGRYEIRIQGGLDPEWSEWLQGLEVRAGDGETVISGVVPDQAALHGLLSRVRDLNLTLLSVRLLEAGRDERGMRSDEE